MDVDGAGRGLVAALVPLAAVVFGRPSIELIPRDDRRRRAGVPRAVVHRRVGLGQAADRCRWSSTSSSWRSSRGSSPRGSSPGVVIGLILAVILFAVNYGRIDLVHEVPFGATFRSNVDRPPAERVVLGDWPSGSRSSA